MGLKLIEYEMRPIYPKRFGMGRWTTFSAAAEIRHCLISAAATYYNRWRIISQTASTQIGESFKLSTN